MPGKHSRRLPTALVVAVAALALAACGDQYPNSTFTHLTDLNTATDALWNRLLLFGTIVFVFVEVLLLVTIFKFRKRPDSPAPKQVHGNAVLEITWTAIPAARSPMKIARRRSAGTRSGYRCHMGSA